MPCLRASADTTKRPIRPSCSRWATLTWSGSASRRVHPLLLLGRHAEAAVLDLDGETGRHLLGAQQHLGVRGREQRGVLDQFGQQMDDVGDGVAAQGAVDRRHQLDPRVLLHLRDGGAQHLRHSDRLAPLATGDRAAEDGEVLRVPADPGGEMVDMEEPLEQLGVLDLVLQLVEQLDLPVDQGLEPPGEIDEDLDLLFVADAAGEPGRLDHGGDGGLVRSAPTPGQQVEFVSAGSADGVRRAGTVLASAELLDHRAQIRLSDGRWSGAASCTGPVRIWLPGPLPGAAPRWRRGRGAPR